MPGSVVGEATEPPLVTANCESDKEQYACNGLSTPQQSTSELKYMDNSIFNTISKIVNCTAKVRCRITATYTSYWVDVMEFFSFSGAGDTRL